MFWRKKSSSGEIQKLYMVDLSLRYDDEHIYISSLIVEEIMGICMQFGIQLLKSEMRYSSVMRVIVKCTYTEMSVLITELRKKFSRLGINEFCEASKYD